MVADCSPLSVHAFVLVMTLGEEKQSHNFTWYISFLFSLTPTEIEDIG